MPERSAPIVGIGPALTGSVLVEKRSSGAVMKVWFFCSTGKAVSKLVANPLSAGAAAAADIPGFNRPMRSS